MLIIFVRILIKEWKVISFKVHKYIVGKFVRDAYHTPFAFLNYIRAAYGVLYTCTHRKKCNVTFPQIVMLYITVTKERSSQVTPGELY